MHIQSASWRSPQRVSCTHAGRLAVLVITVGIAGVLGSGALAQDTRSTTAGNCPLTPVTVPLFEGTPAVVIAATPAAAIPAEPEAGDQVALGAAASDMVACINTGDPSFAYAIFTPRYLATQFVDEAGHYQPEFESRLDRPALPAATQFELVSIENVQNQEDGRIQLTLVLVADQNTFRDTFLLAYVDGHWLIDEVVALDPAP